MTPLAKWASRALLMIMVLSSMAGAIEFFVNTSFLQGGGFVNNNASWDFESGDMICRGVNCQFSFNSVNLLFDSWLTSNHYLHVTEGSKMHARINAVRYIMHRDENISGVPGSIQRMYWNNNDYTRDIANDFQPGFPLNISATTPTTYDIATSGQCYITGAKPCFPEYPNLVEAPTPWTVYMYVSAPYTFGGSNVVIDDDNLFVQFRFSITKTPLNATVVDDWTIEVSGENLGEGVEPGEQGGAIWTVQSANLTESNVPFQRPVEDASQTWNTSLARVQIDPSHCDNMFNTVTLSIQASLDTVEISCFDLVAVQTGTGSSGGESEDDPEPTTGDDVEEDGEDEDEDGGDSSGEGLTPTVQLSVGIGAVALLVVLLALRPSSGTEKPEKQRLTLAKAEQAEGLKSKNKALSRTKGPSKGNSSKQPKSGKSKTLTPNPANESERSSVSQVSVGSRSSTGAISTASSVLTRREMKRR